MLAWIQAARPLWPSPTPGGLGAYSWSETSRQQETALRPPPTPGGWVKNIGLGPSRLWKLLVAATRPGGSGEFYWSGTFKTVEAVLRPPPAPGGRVNFVGLDPSRTLCVYSSPLRVGWANWVGTSGLHAMPGVNTHPGGLGRQSGSVPQDCTHCPGGNTHPGGLGGQSWVGTSRLP